MELVQLLDQALAQTTFRTEDQAVLSAEDLGQALSASYWGAPGRKRAMV